MMYKHAWRRHRTPMRLTDNIEQAVSVDPCVVLAQKGYGFRPQLKEYLMVQMIPASTGCYTPFTFEASHATTHFYALYIKA